MIYRISLTHPSGDRHVAADVSEASAMVKVGWQFVSMRGYSTRANVAPEPVSSEKMVRCKINA